MDTNPKQAAQVASFPELLTEDQVAEMLSVSPRHVGYLRQRRLLPYIRLGRIVRFDRAQLIEAVAALTVATRTS
jgi:excisionase family DNA binding protein